MSSARDLAALAAFTARDAVLPTSAAKRRPEGSTSAALTRAGLSDAVIADVLRPFLSGVFLEDRLETSARFFHLVWRSMVRGSLCLPAEGIGAVPARLADGLPDGVLRLGRPSRRSPTPECCWSTGARLGTDRPGRAEAVLRRLAELHGTDTSGWRQVAAYTFEGALPAMLPPWPLSRTTRLGPGRYVCGDHRATGSVQGALAPGARAAREVLADSGRQG